MARQGASRGWLADAATNRRKCEANGPRATADLSDVSGVVTMEAPGATPRRHCHAETAHDTCSRRGATWRSGDAADCKSAHPGSIPGVASLKSPKIREKCRDKNAERVTNAERAGHKNGHGKSAGSRYVQAYTTWGLALLASCFLQRQSGWDARQSGWDGGADG